MQRRGEAAAAGGIGVFPDPEAGDVGAERGEGDEAAHQVLTRRIVLVETAGEAQADDRGKGRNQEKFTHFVGS